MNSIRVLHTGDLHLGYSSEYDAYKSRVSEKYITGEDNMHRFNAGQCLYARDTVLVRIIDKCIEENIDVMLVAGDLFDSDKPDEALVTYIIEQFNRIREVIVMVAPGNHDYYVKDSYYDRISTLCENVFIFDGEMDFYEFNIRNHTVRIYGAGFNHGIERKSLMKQRKMFRDIAITLGVFHGEIGNEGEMSMYAPMSLTMIEDNCFDYLALGHIHKQTGVLRAGRTNYAYCGCPEGLDFGECGEKGVYLGEVGLGYADMEYVKVCSRMFIRESIDAGRLHNQAFNDRILSGEMICDGEELGKYIIHILGNKYGRNYRDNLYRINLKNIEESEVDTLRMLEELEELAYAEVIYEGGGRARTNRIRRLGTERAEKAEETEREGTGRIAEKINRHDNKSATQQKGSGFVINRIHIVNFGGLKDMQMNFTGSFQIIYGGNEYGKTTIMAFIRMMLYGCVSRSQDITQNLRKKYQPHDGSTMKGSLEFSIDGRNYVVERTFGKSKSMDTCRIIDMFDGREIGLAKGQEVGDYYLGISGDDFDKTIFAGNVLLVDGSKNLIPGKILGMVAGGESEGFIEELKDINRELDKLSSKREVSGKIPEIEEKTKEYIKEIRRLKENRKYVKEELEDREGLVRERNVLKNLLRDIDKCEREEMGEDENERENIGVETKEFTDKAISYSDGKKNFMKILVIIVVAIMLLVIAKPGGISGNNRDMGIMVIVAGTLAIIWLIRKIAVINRIQRQTPFEDEVYEKKTKYKENDYEEYDMKDAKENVSAWNGEKDRRDRIRVIIEKMGYQGYSIEDLNDRLLKINNKLASGTSGTSEYHNLEDRINRLEYRLDELRHQKQEYIKRQDELIARRKSIEEKIRSTEEGLSGIVSARSAEIFAKISGIECEHYVVDDGLAIKIKRRGSAVYEDYRTLSTATVSQAYLSLRIALCESMEECLTLPMLFDDFLSVYDRERVERTIKMLKELETQIIMFTCHEWIVKIGEQT